QRSNDRVLQRVRLQIAAVDTGPVEKPEPRKENPRVPAKRSSGKHGQIVSAFQLLGSGATAARHGSGLLAQSSPLLATRRPPRKKARGGAPAGGLRRPRGGGPAPQCSRISEAGIPSPRRSPRPPGSRCIPVASERPARRLQEDKSPRSPRRFRPPR